MTGAQSRYSLRPYDQVGPMVLEISVVGRDALWSLWETQKEKYNIDFLGSWNKAIPFAVTIIHLLKTSLGGLVETSCLTMMVHQVTIWPEVSIIN